MRILFITSTRIGDAVLSTAALNHVLNANPNAEVTVAAGAVAAPLFDDLPQLEKLIAITKQPYAAHWFELWRRVVGTKWNMVIDGRGSALGYMLRARRRIIYSGGNQPIHRVARWAALMGAPANPHAFPTRLWLGSPRIARIAPLAPSDKKYICVAPAANWAGKEWPLDYFIQLVTRLTRGGIVDGYVPLVVCAPNERARLQSFFDAFPEALDASRLGHLLDVACVMQGCDYFIGNDSGLMHMAAALGLPTLGLFGPSNDQHYAPWGTRAGVVRTPETVTELCSAPDFDHRRTGSLMHSLSVESAENAFTHLVNA